MVVTCQRRAANWALENAIHPIDDKCFDKPDFTETSMVKESVPTPADVRAPVAKSQRFEGIIHNTTRVTIGHLQAEGCFD